MAFFRPKFVRLGSSWHPPCFIWLLKEKMREGIEMRTDRSEEWLKGGTSFYRLKKRDEKDESERGVVLRGRTWVIKAISD